MDSLYFTMLNHNKRSITLNTKTARCRAIFTRLVEECDVLVENFAPGALDRMGLTWERIQEINPWIVYASVKGFGPGPYQECKVYENVAQCTGGSQGGRHRQRGRGGAGGGLSVPNRRSGRRVEAGDERVRLRA